MSTTVAPALKALLERFIDYAGVFPPSGLTLDVAIDNYNKYRQGEHAWMLRWFVVGAADLQRVPKLLDGSLSVLGDSDEARATSMEAKSIIHAKRPVYCEVAPDTLQALDAIRQSGCYAKIRTGGLKAEAIPSAVSVAAFINACAQRRLAFKATAGLHHAIRAEHPLTYETDAPKAVMHGFINVLMASAFAWHGERQIEPIVSETDPSAFSFDESAKWWDKSLDANQIREARQNFMHSVGSCSFEEPIQGLQALGFLNASV